MQIRLLLALLLLLVASSGCNMVYKVDVQQGNVLDQRLVDELRPGMSKRQVSLILGTPAIASPFHQDRWDYITAYHRRGELTNRKILSLTFEQNRLVQIQGDYKPGGADVVDEDDAAAEDA